MRSKFAYEAWTITEEGFSAENLRENESDFALGNGFIGMRGNLEENIAGNAETIQGTFLNGIFDSEPITYGETAYGYAKNHETICNVMDGKSIYLMADDEWLDIGKSNIEGHRRVLDMRKGFLYRTFIWNTKNGAKLKIEMKRLVSLKRSDTAAMKVQISCLKGESRIMIRSEIRPAKIAEGDSNDPRNASGKDRTLKLVRKEINGDCLLMQQKTKNTGFVISCAVKHCFEHGCETEEGAEYVTWEGRVSIKETEQIQFEKHVCYMADRINNSSSDMAESMKRAARTCSLVPDFDRLAAEQEEYLNHFWKGAGIAIEGDDALLQGLQFNLFHLLQSAGRDGKRNIAAKGLTGEGYEGHYFWDTESYIIPVFLHTEPSVARKLLEYRYSILPNARNRARIMGHPSGALFAWRTIDGEECSAYFPAGTAQYHINGDIAYAVWTYYYVTEDLDFMAKYGAEILVETARLFYDLGFYSNEKEGKFVINCVTGPDEYNVMVNNNAYTNHMAAANFHSAAMAMQLLEENCPKDYRRLCEGIGYQPKEASDWLSAAKKMYYPQAQNGIYPQDEEFLNRKPWPLHSIPAENHPLLMYYHGLTIYRHMVCKQADLILAMTLFGDKYTLEEKRKNFAFYDGVTTHDSSLSMAVFSILACEIGEIEKAYDYFMDSARLDLDDIHHNSKDGLHMANMAGTWNCIAKGFGGMRYKDGTLSFSPVCPAQWKGYSFRVRFRKRTIDVHVRGKETEYTLVEGMPITIYHNGNAFDLK
jgi:Trehalose and maltose hydrolases (possible phosphorylases)